MIVRLATLATAIAVTSAGAAHSAENDQRRSVASELIAAPLEQAVSPYRGIQLTSESGDTSVAFRFGGETSFGRRGTTSEGTSKSAGVLNAWSVALSTPIGDGGGDTTLSTLDALSSGTTLEAKFSSTTVSRPTGDETERMAAMNSLCEAVNHGPLTADQSCSFGFVKENAKGDQAAAQVRQFRELIAGRWAWVWGLKGRAGTKTFDYIDPATLAERSVDKGGWSVGAFYAARLLSTPFLGTIGVEHQDAYEAQDTATLCPTDGGACVEGAAGAPQRVRKDIISADLRAAFEAFSVSATLSYDLNNDVLAVEAPLYLTRNADGAFNGGVKLNWRDDTDEVAASVFIGKAFNMGMP